MIDIQDQLHDIKEQLAAILDSQGDCWCDLTALSQHACVGKTTLRTLIKTGELPAYRAGGKRLVRKSDFDSWLKKRRIQPVDLNKIVDEVMESFN